MRKSTSLKLGLNLRKSKPSANKEPNFEKTVQRSSVFADSLVDPLENKEEEHTQASSAPRHLFSGGSLARESEKLATDLEATDPSVYAYDEYHDSISEARSRIKNIHKGNDNKPRYMEKLLETAKRRQMQKEIVKEKVLEKERQREGEKFADKETFVTSAYREQKEQRQRLVKEEEEREGEKEEKKRRAASGNRKELSELESTGTGFYRGYLDQMDRDDMSKVIYSQKTDTGDQKSSSEKQTEINAGAKDKELSAGLNFVSSRKQYHSRDERQANVVASNTIDAQAQPDIYQTKYQHQSRRFYQVRDKNYAEHVKQKADSNIQTQEALTKKYARRNDEVAIEAARQRYLARTHPKSQHV
ncbi:hypothetical protein GGI25_003234 [Coemansia spiralis]|uniref:Nuclear speckle splicing regulatory protein 1 N-terminal domain-containing protein n=2 Tax=Coemansia TaxID=4863 RepID=A0A9W8G8W2_9FUNG|nr:coiled-coil domain-containing protein 55-domain containing protein [Coemansia spiralis]KAJ1987603.1 hypothetical protein EDC05_005745 [Coemansia umbellata]KAJ2619399.1 hypothetical protein GGI26_005860 [Coemansia sp. RSA 1358]KAJ2677139.1 hypothetical protein GGI25_003234 [Coemansia spiralis]